MKLILYWRPLKCVLVKLNCIKSRMEKDIRLHALEEKKTETDTVRQK